MMPWSGFAARREDEAGAAVEEEMQISSPRRRP